MQPARVATPPMTVAVGLGHVRTAPLVPSSGTRARATVPPAGLPPASDAFTTTSAKGLPPMALAGAAVISRVVIPPAVTSNRALVAVTPPEVAVRT